MWRIVHLSSHNPLSIIGRVFVQFEPENQKCFDDRPFFDDSHKNTFGNTKKENGHNLQCIAPFKTWKICLPLLSNKNKEDFGPKKPRSSSLSLWKNFNRKWKWTRLTSLLKMRGLPSENRKLSSRGDLRACPLYAEIWPKAHSSSPHTQSSAIVRLSLKVIDGHLRTLQFIVF